MRIFSQQAILQFPAHTNWVSHNLTQILQVKGLVLQGACAFPTVPPLPTTSDDSYMVSPQVYPKFLPDLATTMTPSLGSFICQNGSQNSGEKDDLLDYSLITKDVLKDIKE